VKKLLIATSLYAATSAFALTTIRVNTSTAGAEATGGNSFGASISADGNWVAFTSLANNLDLADTNTVTDVYLKNLNSGQLTLVSRGANGVGNAASNLPAISADGRFIAFFSTASNLVANDTNGVADVFLYDVSNSTLELISVNSAGVQGNGSSGNCASNCFSVSGDGRFVTFESTASNLSPIDSDNISDIYLRDRQTSTTVLVSQSTAGAIGGGGLGSNKPAINANGRYVAFESSRILEASDTNNTGDIYLRDVVAGTTTRINTSISGANTTAGFSARPSISDDGRIVAFRSLSNELVPSDNSAATQRDVFVKNVTTGAIRRAEIPGGGDPNGDSNELSLSGDGQFLIFHSLATNFGAGDTNNAEDILRMNLATGAVERLSLSTENVEATGSSTFPKVNRDGSTSAYESTASNLVTGDSNTRTDIFVTEFAGELLFADGFE
jgi:hypothetical protein